MNTVMKYEFKGSRGEWAFNPDTKLVFEQRGHYCISICDNIDNERVKPHFKIVPKGFQDEKLYNGHLIAASPLLLSALIKAVEFEEHKERVYKIADSVHAYPSWYYEAKSAIEAALNLKTVEPPVASSLVEDYCTLEQAKELKKQGYTIDKPDYYWVDQSAWGKGYQLMSAHDAEYRAAETKHTAFVDFDTTYIAFEAHDADELLNARK